MGQLKMTISSKKVVQQPQPSQPSEPKAKDLSDVVVDGVLARLGKPDNLDKVTAKNVGGTRFRVNVWRRILMDEGHAKRLGLERLTESVKITHSYYVTANEHGEILSSSPEIKREFGNDTKPKRSVCKVSSNEAPKATSATQAPIAAT